MSHSFTRPFPSRFFPLCLLLSFLPALSPAQEWREVESILGKYCYDCHGGEKTRGGVNLKELAENPNVAGHFSLWETVEFVLEDGEMPPPDDPQPSVEEMAVIHTWLEGALLAAASANAGDPGLVTMRRLTNVEYDQTLRDLAGIDLSLSAEFLPDGGGGEGFSNVGDVLFMSPQQLDKYLAAARKLTDHASILPGRGIAFRENRVGLRSPVQLRTEAEQSLYIWYQEMAAPHLPGDDDDRREADYMLAAWKHRHREQTGAASLENLAKEAGLVPAFLENWWNLLQAEQPQSRFLDMIRLPWRSLPGPDGENPTEVPPAVLARIQEIQNTHRTWNKREGEGWIRTQRRQQDTDGLRSREIAVTIEEGQPIHLVAGDFGDGNRGDLILFETILIERAGKRIPYLTWLRERVEANGKRIREIEASSEKATLQKELAELAEFQKQAAAARTLFGKHPLGLEIEDDTLAAVPPAIITLPFGERARIRTRARMEMDHPEADHGSHQWTVTGSNPPDPSQIIPGALIIYKRQTDIAREIMGEFGRMRSAFPDEYPRLLEEVARNYQRGGKGTGVYYLNDEQLRATLTARERDRHDRMLKDWRLLSRPEPTEDRQKEIDRSLLEHLHSFGTRAWRRPLADTEREALSALYHDARKRELDPESASREVLMRILVSPNFLFKLEESREPGVHPITPWELATRLSYFLWSSLPDGSLRKAAADGSLATPAGLEAQVRRMLRDRRSEALAEEFAGQWLEFHRFSSHDAVDGDLFPEFTPELSSDLHREAQEFFHYLIREDRPAKEIILADYTFLNERLAHHYGIPGVEGETFRKVTVADHQRGGVLGMGSILTKTSFPRRTSPVLRGDWLLHAVLGQPAPPPPPDVPELEEVATGLSIREKLKAHRDHEACSTCHDRIDPLGFALDSFDAIGRLRTLDDEGHEIDDTGTLRDGTSLEGFSGLRRYLAAQDLAFYEIFARKLIGYALGRSILASDRQLIEEISLELQESNGSFGTAVLRIAESKQFQYRRNGE